MTLERSTGDSKEAVMWPDDHVIDIPRDFSKVPGGRFARMGPYSGEDFRKKMLAPALRQAQAARGTVVVKLDGAAGYPASFLEEAFAGLIRQDNFTLYDLKNVLILDAKAQRFMVLRDLAWKYMSEAEQAARQG